MSGNGKHKPKPKSLKGVFSKDEEKYRKTCESCGNGFHEFRWNAHHIVPADTFKGLHRVVKGTLEGTKFNINDKEWLFGLPKLTAFILWAQADPNMPYNRRREKTVTMRRWGKVRAYLKEKNVKVAFPGDFPVHNPVNWGHTQYNKHVFKKLEPLFESMKPKKGQKPGHPPFKDIKAKLEKVRDEFKNQLGTISKTKHPGALDGGIEPNLRARYDQAKDGWWKPMCMTKSTPKPISPSLA